MHVRDFVTTAKGTKKRHNALHLSDLMALGGFGLHRVYWSFRCPYLSLMQRTLRDHNSLIRQMAEAHVNRRMAPMTNYGIMLRQF